MGFTSPPDHEESHRSRRAPRTQLRRPTFATGCNTAASESLSPEPGARESHTPAGFSARPGVRSSPSTCSRLSNCGSPVYPFEEHLGLAAQALPHQLAHLLRWGAGPPGRGLPVSRLEHRWNTSLERCGLPRTSTDSAPRPGFAICREIAESARWTRLTRNEGVPGSSPGVGF